MKRRLTITSIGLVAALTLAACSGSSNDVSDQATKALAPVTTTSTTTTAPSSASTTTTRPDDQCVPSLPPASPLPAPGDFQTGGALSRIFERGYLIAGIDENTPGLGARDPRTAKFSGLEVEMVWQIAEKIFGDRNPDRVRFKTIVTKEKNQVVEDKEVDLTASADSITCAREEKVDFSTEYLQTGHVLLVRAHDDISAIDQLAGRTVCVTKGSSSLGLLTQNEQLSKARPLEVDARNDCLVALQQGDADAYLGHTTFVRGMREQDPDNLEILEESLHDQHYGIAVAKDPSNELVMFVNGVLQQMHDDGSLARLFRENELPIEEMRP